ncbi:MAG: hypothetical protein KGL92_12340 [Gammaproteobacteria bacterium]|nr:hypothetical protein [Gammaproteobacteria bacterium]
MRRDLRSMTAGVMLAAGAIAGAGAIGGLSAASAATVSAAAGPKAAPAPHPMHYRPNAFAGEAGRYYRLVWGIDSLSVTLVGSGEMVRFNYRVLDPARAAVLNDVRAAPSLIDQRARVSLVVPSMDMVGELREKSAPEAGKSYWMTFANTGRPVRRGDRVTVVVGGFRADDLVVR